MVPRTAPGALEHRRSLDTPSRVALDGLLQEVAADNAERLAARGQALVLECDAGLAVVGDAFLLRQAIDNLVDNASDFAPAGSAIRLQAHRDGGEACIEVRDRGPGVPEFALGRVFERFYSLPRPDGGAGISARRFHRPREQNESGFPVGAVIAGEDVAPCVLGIGEHDGYEVS